MCFTALWVFNTNGQTEKTNSLLTPFLSNLQKLVLAAKSLSQLRRRDEYTPFNTLSTAIRASEFCVCFHIGDFESIQTDRRQKYTIVFITTYLRRFGLGYNDAVPHAEKRMNANSAQFRAMVDDYRDSMAFQRENSESSMRSFDCRLRFPKLE